ncbi:hypothetical protein [Natronomonas sp. EA1]|uniref:hypothetical protein n=1 Tax=Natronomonas sp. EA1 TaxID=3421655 RepID=UPI003EBA794B
MTQRLGVDELAAILLDEHRYDNALPPKAFHKIAYFAQKELDEIGLSANISYFWYRYGIMTCTSGSSVGIDRGSVQNELSCNTDPDDLQLSENEEMQLRLAVNRALKQFYNLSLEGLTDKMYEEAPHDFQRHYRTLDKQLSTVVPTGPDYLAKTPTKEDIRETLFEFCNSFREDPINECLDDMLVFYRCMSDELDSENWSPNDLQEISRIFWGIVSAELAQKENSGLSLEQIAAEFEKSPEEFLSTQRGMRRELRTFEREDRMDLRQGSISPVTKSAADAVVTSIVDISWE